MGDAIARANLSHDQAALQQSIERQSGVVRIGKQQQDEIGLAWDHADVVGIQLFGNPVAPLRVECLELLGEFNVARGGSAS